MSAESESLAKKSNPPSPPPSLLHAVVRGKVQGVGFRQFLTEKAAVLGIRGTVRNLPDGRSVEVYAQGPQRSLDTLLAHLKRGPAGSRVLQIEAAWQPPRDLPLGFFILPG
ncbi:MAG: acylphosphatase [SAR202 cluster bacterium]|nr:acylphosphatase [SAR202 cluster bacterium]